MKEWITGDIIIRNEDNTVALKAPVFTIPSTRVSDGFLDIEIKNANTLGDVFYTVDGSTPTEESFRYTSPFKIYNSSVVKVL